LYPEGKQEVHVGKPQEVKKEPQQTRKRQWVLAPDGQIVPEEEVPAEVQAAPEAQPRPVQMARYIQD